MNIPQAFGKDANAVDTLLTRIEEVYAVTVAQVYSERRRFATSPEDPAATHSVMLFTAGKTRIWQDTISTRILQGLLGAMMLCAIIAMLLTNMRRVLPQSPCSIAAVATYLAKSSILGKEVIPPGSELLNTKELREKGILEDGFYSFGWWGNRQSRRYGIDIGKAEKE